MKIKKLKRFQFIYTCTGCGDTKVLWATKDPPGTRDEDRMVDFRSWCHVCKKIKQRTRKILKQP